MKVFKLFDPNVSFFSLKIVQLTFLINIVLVLISLTTISYVGKYEFDLSGAGYNFFIKEFTFPIGLLSTLIPIIAVFAVQHRSNQTIAQILESTRKNNFDISVRHYELFEIYLKDEGFSEHIKKHCVNLKRFHSSLFSEIYEGNVEITNEISAGLESSLKKINTSIINYQNIQNNQSSSEAEQELNSISKYIDELLVLFDLNNSPTFHLSYTLKKDEIKYLDALEQYVKELIEIFKFINSSFNFSHNYKTPPLLHEGLTDLVLLTGAHEPLSFGLQDYSNETLERGMIDMSLILKCMAHKKLRENK